MATDTPLVLKARRGDRRAFGELVRRHHARLIASARALVGDADAAEDLSQDSFVEAFSSLGKLEKPKNFRAWLFGIMRHKALNHLRTAGREVTTEAVPEPSNPGPENPPETDLRDRLVDLPERHREVLAAKYLQDLSYAEIAEQLGITVNTVRVRCFRAKQALRELLLAEGELPVEEATT